MAKREVGIVFKAYDEASREMAKIGLGSQKLTRQLTGLAAGYLSVRALTGAVRAVTSAAMEQQKAEMGLQSSLARTGDATGENMAAFKTYASQIQALTTYSDEQILSQMAYAHNVGVSTDQLDEATIAAIGLARAYDKDLDTAYRLIALAAKGETGQLKEMGIVIDKNLSPREKYNELLRQGAEAFRLETEYAETAAGTHEKLGVTWNHTKEILGEALLPAAQSTFQSINNWLESNENAIKGWSMLAVAGIGAVVDAFKAADDAVADLWYTKRTPNPTIDVMGSGGGMSDLGVLDRGDWWSTEPGEVGPRIPKPDSMAGIQARANALKVSGLPELKVSSSNTDGGSELDRRYMEQTAEEESKLAAKRATAIRRMYNDMDQRTAESFNARQKMLEEEYKNYDTFIEEKALLDQWYNEQKHELDIEQAKASQDFVSGFRAGLEEMKRDAETLGQVGAGVAGDMRDGFRGIFTDAMKGGHEFESLMLNMLDRIGDRGLGFVADSIFDAATGGIGSLFKVPARAAGGPVSSGSPYLVGERGPELFVPRQSGSIVPSGSPNVNISVTNNGTAKSVQTTQPMWNGRDYIIGVILDDYDHGGPLSDRMR